MLVEQPNQQINNYITSPTSHNYKAHVAI